MGINAKFGNSSASISRKAAGSRIFEVIESKRLKSPRKGSPGGSTIHCKTDVSLKKALNQRQSYQDLPDSWRFEYGLTTPNSHLPL